MPFDNFVATVKLSGRQLRDALALLAGNEKQLPQVSGLTVRFTRQAMPMRTIVNGEGKSLTVSDPVLALASIDDEKIYTVAMADFLATGGNGLDFLMRALKPAPVASTTRLVRDAIVDYLRAHPDGVGGVMVPRLVEQK
jgi:2',3'-cyclic-nucleotide 2'-phosphodiesterase (5'-nucleotidase family)